MTLLYKFSLPLFRFPPIKNIKTSSCCVVAKRANFSTIMSCGGNQNQQQGFEMPRYVVKKVLAKPQQEGVGAIVRRSIGRYFCFCFFHFWLILWIFFYCLWFDLELVLFRSELRSLDPFLMLDEFSGLFLILSCFAFRLIISFFLMNLLFYCF